MIRLILSEADFEYDIRGLLTSFFPGEEISACIGETKELRQEGEKRLFVGYRETFLQTALSTDEGSWEKCCEAGPDRTETKNRLKRLIDELLSACTGKELPWGTLTGIRPTKLPMAMLEEGCSEEEILSHLRRTYLLGEEKARLSLDIARREREILKDIDYENGYSLYVGIPFCPTTCLYCSFTSYPMGKWAPRMGEYLQALYRELDYIREAFAGRKLNTVYIGGGTPTSLSAEQLDELLSYLDQSFDYSYLQEFTVEAGRPDSVTEEKLKAIQAHPVTRISVNPQTMKEETLRLIGRRHTVEDVKRTYHLARRLGFDNINMDLILGLPGETREDVAHTMEDLRALAPDNVTVHSLALKRAARLNLEWERYESMAMENSQEHMELVARYAKEMGLEPYYLYRQKNMAGNLENVGYAAPDKAGIYNILIMEEKQTIAAAGAGSTTKAVFGDGRIARADNVKDIEQYLARTDEMIQRKRDLFEKGIGR